MTDPLHTPTRQPGDPDAAPRPRRLAEFVGQEAARVLEELGEGASEGDLIRVALKKAAG